MEVVLFVSSLIALLALTVFLIHRIMLDERYFESDRQRDDEILDTLSEISATLEHISISLMDTSDLECPDPDPDYIDCCYEDSEEE